MTATVGVPRPGAPGEPGGQGVTRASGTTGVPTPRGAPSVETRSFVPAVRPVRRRHGHRRLWAAGLLTAVVLGGTTVGVDVLRAPDAAGPSTEQVSQALADLAWAQEAYHRRHDAYAPSVLALVGLGWRPTPGVRVRVVDAGPETYCLAAGPSDGEPSAWLSQDWLLGSTPCA